MKKYLVAIAGIVGIVLVVGGIKAMQIRSLIAMGENMQMPPTFVSTVEVERQLWERSLSAVGTLESVQGVMVTADIPGRVTEILFKAGSEVKQGDVLIRQDISSELAQLRAAEASVALAKASLERVSSLYKQKVASKAELDGADARFKEAVAQADNIRTTIDKKTVKAPFSGRLGIRLANIGKDLGKGDPIVSLQAIDPIYVNFSLPQRDLPKLALDLAVRVTSDAVPGKIFTGKITTINPEIDPATRSIRVQASLDNIDRNLLPGMYVNLDVVLPESEDVLVIPSTAIAYATFGDSVFVVTEEKEGEATKKVANQQFVRLGRARGDYVVIEAGVNEGDTVVATGVFKLQNGAVVAENNDVQPDFSVTPTPEDS